MGYGQHYENKLQYQRPGAPAHEVRAAVEVPAVERGCRAEHDEDIEAHPQPDKALSDGTTWDKVIADPQAMIERIGRLGVPTIVLDGGDGGAIFGPVISDMPTDEDAVELWRHTAWLARYGNFAELKRKRARITELPVMEWYKEQRAKAAAAEPQRS